MKVLRFTFILLLLACTLPGLSQNPLLGTWERKTESIWAIKVITPTHWMIFIQSRQGDGNPFVRAHGGTYTLHGNNYIEQLDITSWDNKSDYTSTDYSYKIVADTFYLTGILVLSDGSVHPIDEVWQKVHTPHVNADYPAIGTWQLVSETQSPEAGQKESPGQAASARFELITPTHWMRISRRDYDFESALGGTYTAAGSKAQFQVDFASTPAAIGQKLAVTEKVARDKRSSTTLLTGPDGKKVAEFEAVYKRAPGKAQTAK